MTEHTALPWKAIQDTLNWVIVDKNHTIVVESIVDDASARFIVTACNNHADLLKALRAMLREHGPPLGGHRHECVACTQAYEAIRKAEEQAK